MTNKALLLPNPESALTLPADAVTPARIGTFYQPDSGLDFQAAGRLYPVTNQKARQRLNRGAKIAL
jgi:hypothetical protein